MNKKYWRWLSPDEFNTLYPNTYELTEEQAKKNQEEGVMSVTSGHNCSLFRAIKTKEQADLFMKRLNRLRRKANSQKS